MNQLELIKTVTEQTKLPEEEVNKVVIGDELNSEREPLSIKNLPWLSVVLIYLDLRKLNKPDFAEFKDSVDKGLVI